MRHLAFNGAEILVRVSAYTDPWGATPPLDWWTLFNCAHAAENTAYWSQRTKVRNSQASPRADRNRCLAPVYALTRICHVEYIKRVESVFEIIAEPNRRAILSLLVSSQQSVGQIERQLRMPQPTVSKHLRVLREAGFVEFTVDAQRRLYRLKPEPLQEVDAWLAPFRRFWSAHVDALERHLDRMDQSTPTKRKTRRRR
jgi:DNA-binding transcriptional ArsR family regulator